MEFTAPMLIGGMLLLVIGGLIAARSLAQYREQRGAAHARALHHEQISAAHAACAADLAALQGQLARLAVPPVPLLDPAPALYGRLIDEWRGAIDRAQAATTHAHTMLAQTAVVSQPRGVRGVFARSNSQQSTAAQRAMDRLDAQVQAAWHATANAEIAYNALAVVAPTQHTRLAACAAQLKTLRNRLRAQHTATVNAHNRAATAREYQRVAASAVQIATALQQLPHPLQSSADTQRVVTISKQLDVLEANVSNLNDRIKSH